MSFYARTLPPPRGAAHIRTRLRRAHLVYDPYLGRPRGWEAAAARQGHRDAGSPPNCRRGARAAAAAAAREAATRRVPAQLHPRLDSRDSSDRLPGRGQSSSSYHAPEGLDRGRGGRANPPLHARGSPDQGEGRCAGRPGTGGPGAGPGLDRLARPASSGHGPGTDPARGRGARATGVARDEAGDGGDAPRAAKALDRRCERHSRGTQGAWDDRGGA